MSKIMVAIIDIENKEGYKDYQDEVLPMFERLGIDVLAVDDEPKAIEALKNALQQSTSPSPVAPSPAAPSSPASSVSSSSTTEELVAPPIGKAISTSTFAWIQVLSEDKTELVITGAE